MRTILSEKKQPQLSSSPCLDYGASKLRLARPPVALPLSRLSPPSLAGRLKAKAGHKGCGERQQTRGGREGKGRRTSGGEGGQRPLQRRVCMHARQRGLFRYILMFLYVDTTLLAFSKSVASIPEQRRARIIKEGGRKEREGINARNSLRPRPRA